MMMVNRNVSWTDPAFIDFCSLFKPYVYETVDLFIIITLADSLLCLRGLISKSTLDTDPALIWVTVFNR